jgi:hypothetical protein
MDKQITLHTSTDETGASYAGVIFGIVGDPKHWSAVMSPPAAGRPDEQLREILRDGWENHWRRMDKPHLDPIRRVFMNGFIIERDGQKLVLYRTTPPGAAHLPTHIADFVPEVLECLDSHAIEDLRSA